MPQKRIALKTHGLGAAVWPRFKTMEQNAIVEAHTFEAHTFEAQTFGAQTFGTKVLGAQALGHIYLRQVIWANIWYAVLANKLA